MFLIGFKVQLLKILHKIIGQRDELLSIPSIAFATLAVCGVPRRPKNLAPMAGDAPAWPVNALLSS